MKRIALFVLVTCLGSCFPVTGQGIIVTVAGSSVFPSNVSVALDAPLGNVSGVAVDSQGNVYVVDPDSDQILLVSPQGNVRIVAGNGTYGFTGDGGPAVAASLSYPTAVAVDGSGDIFIADFGNRRIRKVSASGIITTVAGGGNSGLGDGGPATSASFDFPNSVAVDAAGNLFIADNGYQLASSEGFGQRYHHYRRWRC